MQKLLLSALAICLIISACSKPQDSSGFEDPVFIVTYQDTAPVTITAGLDGVYLFTKLALGGDNVYTSINTFSDANCPAGDCPGSLSFEFRGGAGIDSLFLGGQYPYTLPDSFSNTPAPYSVEMIWGNMFNDFLEQKFVLVGNDSTVLYSPNVGTTRDLPDILHKIYLTGYGANGLIGNTYSRFLPSNLAANPRVIIKASPDGLKVSLAAIQDLSSSSVTSYQWNTGDTSAIISIDSTQVGQFYAVTVTDSQDNTASASLSTLPIPLTSEIRSPSIGIQSTPTANPLQLGTVAIQWVDSDSKIWRSNLGAQQPGNSLFNVISSEQYEVNELGNPTLKLVVAFKCLLYTKEGAVRWFEGEGIIAMARP